MDAFLDRFLSGLPLDAGGGVVQQALASFYAFTLVLVRMSGLMLIGPLFGQPVIPPRARVLLAVLLALLVTPTLPRQAERGFERLDTNADGFITRNEIPPPLEERWGRLIERTGREALSLEEWAGSVSVPRTPIAYAAAAAGELALGLVLGLGVFTVLSGFQLAGELIDQQTGIALGEIVNPALDTSASLSGQLLYLLAVVAFLTMRPLGGHLVLVSALVETFQTLPVGEAWVSLPAIELLRDLVHQSLVLAVQVAAPVLAAMSLVALTMGFLGHTVPQINVLVIGFPVRAMVNLLVLGLTLSGAARTAVDLVPLAIDRLRSALSGLP
ncbi:MAG: flagellar biosynthetic protein FliR [Planctomycetes bacterium]|nr:flagellar biosynthetic protein FliR [Planctomycetota bacterium]